MKDRHGAQLLCLFLIAAVVLGAGLGLRDPWPPDEPRFALIAKDMVASGEWLIPRVGGVLYPDKPPLFFWLVAAFYVVTGSLSVALLLPGCLSGLGILWLVYDLARRLWNAQTGLWAGAALLVTVQFPLQMKAGQIDGVLCFWTTLSLYGFCRHLLLGPDWRWYAVAGLACGLGVITKGVGFLPFLVLIPWAFAARRGWPLPHIDWSGGRWLLAPLAFALAVGLWLIPMLLATSGAADPELGQYRDNILLKQTVTRYADSWGHLKPPWYLFTNAIPPLWLPLSFLLPWLVPAWAGDLGKRQAVTLLLGGWILLVLIFFSLSDGKRSVYILPAVPALALLAGYHLPQLLAGRGPRRMLFTLSVLFAALPIGAGVFSLIDRTSLLQWLENPGMAASLPWVLIGAGIACMTIVIASGPKRAAASFAVLSATVWLAASIFVYPLIDATRSGRAVVVAAGQALEDGDALAFAGWKEQFLLQWNQPAVHFGYRRSDGLEKYDAAAWLSQDAAHHLVLPSGMLEPCFDRSQLTELGLAHRQHWFLASNASVLPECRMPAETMPHNIVRYDPYQPRGNGTLAFRNARPPRAKAQAATRSPP
jgi:4-amino-4-deoxy-L-arabinose transferase-like glycosyltransferase